MTSKEALKELFGFAAFEDGCDLDECKKCSVKLKYHCAYRYYKIVEQDLEVLEAIEKSITFKPPKEFKNSLYFNDYIVVYNKCPITKELQEKLTQWVIDNIDKDTVRKWLNEKGEK